MGSSEQRASEGRSRAGFARAGEVEEFAQTLARYERGEISSEQWRAFRLVRGTYGQRQDDASMLRVKLPQGVLNGAQLRALADISERYSRGFGHITTRQNVQFHFMKVDEMEGALRLLEGVGITTREACGNSLRNVTACPYAGVATDELFDVTPYAEALTRYFLRHPLSASLPRKFKVAFEGCPEDHAVTAINDLGFQARIETVDGVQVRGFRVRVGGGTAILCRSGNELAAFLPAARMLDCAEAVVRVFHQHGDRAHRQRNRLKFLIRDKGWEGFKQLFDDALAQVQASGGAPLPFPPEAPPVEQAPDWPRQAALPVEQVQREVAASVIRGPGMTPDIRPQAVTDSAFLRWRKTNVRPQRQKGHAMAQVTTVLGDLTGRQMAALAQLAEAHGDGTIRLTVNQNLLFRWVPETELRPLFERLSAAGLGLSGAEGPSDVTSCPGAEACRLAVTQSRGLGRILGEALRSRPDLVDSAPDLQIKISGCPNGCGQHHIAGLGFQGSVRKVGKRLAPQYFVLVGGAVDGDGARFGRVAAKVPARRLTTVLERLLELYGRDRNPGESATAYFGRVELERVRTLLADLESLTEANAQPEDFVDLGESASFDLVSQEGECAA